MAATEILIKTKLEVDLGSDFKNTTVTGLDPNATDEQLYDLADGIATLRGQELDEARLELEYEVGED